MIAMEAVRSTGRINRIPASGAPGFSLGLLELRSDCRDPRLPPLLLLHGATLGACVFDLPMRGYSLMSALASAGRSVYAVDIRGYGASGPGTVIDTALADHRPFPRAADAVADIDAAVSAICAGERSEAVDLLGFSWGAVNGACYAAAHPERIARLALYAPLYAEINAAWLDRIADPADRARLRADIGGYRFITLADLLYRWDTEIAASDKSLYREPGVAEVVFAGMTSHDELTRSDGRPAYRCPTGALADLVDIFNGRPLYDAARLTMPSLLIRGSEDLTSTDTDTRRLLDAIAAPEKRYVVVTPGSHFLLLERGRPQLYRHLNDFFTPMKACKPPCNERLP